MLNLQRQTDPKKAGEKDANSMGKVSDYLVSLIRRQVEDHGLVVWYDSDISYKSVAEALKLAETTVLLFEGSYLQLREELEPHLEFIDKEGNLIQEREVPPKVVIYVPKKRQETELALVEAEYAGVVMEPGAQALNRNTRLSVVANQYFKLHAPEKAADYARQVEEGCLTLADLDWLADQVSAMGKGTLAIIFGTGALDEIALSFLSSENCDSSILEKKALSELLMLFRTDLGIDLPSGLSPKEVRLRLRRTLLLADFLAAFPAKSRPSDLLISAMPNRRPHLENIRRICRLWRNRLDIRESYIEAARAVEQESQIVKLSLPIEILQSVETFPYIDKRLIEYAEKQILEGQCEKVVTLAEARKDTFWPGFEPSFRLAWLFLEAVGRLGVCCSRIRKELKNIGNSSRAMVSAYAEGEFPWCLVDTYYRHAERLCSILEWDPDSDKGATEQVIQWARRQYSEVMGECADSFSSALEADNFEIAGYPKQYTVFKNFVEKAIQGEEKTAYILVDALRFEMGRELIEGLSDGFEVELKPSLAILPTITEVGMVGLMPGAEKGIEIAEGARGKIIVRVGEFPLTSRAERIDYLEKQTGGKIATLKLSDLAKLSKKRQEEIKHADWVVLTSQEIDRLGEGAEDDSSVHQYMEDVLEKLRKAIRRLAVLGVKYFVLTADHGHLFGENLESGMKIDPPGGYTVDLHPRVWIGRGGRADETYLRVPASRLGFAGDLEFAFPRGVAGFKVKGGVGAYLHGGISLQEMVIPLILAKAKPRPTSEKGIRVELKMEKAAITNRFFSLSVIYTAEGLFQPEEVRVKALVLSDGRIVGKAVMAGYGFEEGTQEVLLRKASPNTITLMLTETKEIKNVTVQIINITTDLTIGVLENIPVNLMI